MIQGEPPSVKHEASGLLGGFTRFPVDRIAHQWSPLVMKVDADLVGAPSVKVAKNQRSERGGVGGEDLVVGDGGLSTGRIDDSHLLAVHRVAADVGENGVFGGLGNPLAHREIEFFHCSTRELVHEGLMSDIRLGDDDAARRIFVETVYDARTLDTADARKFSAAVMEQGVDERAVGISRGRVNDHAGGFIDDHEVVVLEQDFQRNVLCFIVKGDGFRQDDGDAVTELHRIARFGGVAVDLDVLLANERLNPGAGKIRKAGGEKGVDALARTVFD